LQIFRTTRKLGYLAFFFLIGSFSWRDYQRFIRTILVLTTIHTLLYILQYFIGYCFCTLPEQTGVNELGGSRYHNSPPYIIPILVYSVFTTAKSKSKIILIILFFIAIILIQARGLIIATISILLLFQFLQNKIKLQTLLILSLLGIVGYNVTINYFPIITDRFIDLSEEISMTSEMDFNDLNWFYHQGSFIFRLGVTYERLMYVLAEPIRIILGVGFVPDMDITTPIFIVGTQSPKLPTGFEQYNSVDIFFPNIITRYGIVGSIIFLYFILKLFTFSFNNRRLLWGKILLTYLWSLFFISFNNNSFYNGQNFIFIFIMIGLIMIETKYANKNLKCE
jgi:hypothetical protein